MEDFIKNKTGYVLAVVLGVLLFMAQCSRSKEIGENNRLKSNIEALQDTIKYKENKIGGITASKRALEVTEKDLRKQVYVKDERIAKLSKDFDELKSVVKIDQEVKVVGVPIWYADSIPCIFEKKFAIAEKWYNIDGVSTQKGIKINSFSLPNEQFIIIGEKKEGIFKPNYLSVDVVNTNPNFKTKDVTTQVIKIDTPFYNKGWFRVAEIIGSFALGASLAR